MFKCKNDPTKNYKGDEPSPKGLGYCAHVEKIGTKMKGNDNNIWVVKQTSKGIKRWGKNVSMNSKKASEWIKNNILVKDLKKRLKKEEVYLFIEKDFGNNYGINYYWDGVREKLGQNYMDKKFLIVIVNFMLKKPKVIIQHNNITKNTKKKIIEIFKSIFGNKFLWDGKDSHSMEIK